MARTRTKASVADLPETPEGFGTPPEVTGMAPPSEDRVVAVARGPRSVYVYWSLTEGTVSRGAREGPGQLTLRIYTSGERGAQARSLPTSEWVGERVVDVPAGCRVVAAVGFERGDAFTHLARAAAVRPPVGAPGGGPTQMSDGSAAEADSSALQRFSLSRARVGKKIADLAEAL